MSKPTGGTGTDPAAGMWACPDDVAAWLAGHAPEVNPPLTVSRVGIGQSNITTLVVDEAGHEWVMREPPPGSANGNAHDVEREAHILTALATTDVPVPRVVGTGKSPAGSPFLMMERVQGTPLETEDEARTLSPAQRRELGISVAETLGRLHRLDVSTLGITASNTPYVVRQLRRVSAAWERVGAESRHDRAWRAVYAGLSDRMPEPAPPVIMHGDYRLSNLLVSEGRITAVLDWELCTIGDPFADLAWLLDDWRPADEPAIVMPSPTRAGEFPDRDEMVAVYQQITGFGTADLDYYRAFSQWRAASLLEGVRARRIAGAMGTHASIEPEHLEHSIGVLLASAATHLARTG
ncbi:phosphotransferase family protein [Mycolicibacterium palauense]|uniref:phosphotransferase family protein n=1 Tax=Mycolicibacterium palauense TaxID=2034511 RepID=UPI000BFF07A0|nr:phosphotransferase family protein [Mycolicibacterium palauense]